MDQRDQALLAELRGCLDGIDPAPVAAVSAAHGAYSWLTIDAELAALADDSWLAGAGVRSEAVPRSLTFECATGLVALEVSSDGEDQRRILGQTDRPADLQIRHPGGTVTLPTDEHGRFRAQSIAAGPVSLRCVFRDSPDAPVITSWVVV
jgi:hypothetical protein